jgi:hypothetical protein
MFRANWSLLLLLAAAACGAPTKSTAPTASGGATITIATGPADEQFGVRGFDDHGALPAVSADGTLVAALFHDEVDFVGLPVDTVVVWRVADGTRVGAVASNDGADDAPPPDADAAARAGEATALLAGHTWVHATAAATVAAIDGGGADVALGDGRTLRLRELALTLDGAHVTPDAFPAPGDGSEEIGNGPCGTIGSLTVLAAGADWLLAAPAQIDLGGDAGAGRFDSEVAQLFRITR